MLNDTSVRNNTQKLIQAIPAYYKRRINHSTEMTMLVY